MVNDRYVYIRAGVFNDDGTPVDNGDYLGIRGLIQIQENGVWKTIPQVNRAQYFITALERMPDILESLSDSAEFSYAERKMLKDLQDFSLQRKVEIRFRISQGYFQLSPQETTRTASVGSDRYPEIMVNRLLISNPEADIQFLDAVQLIVHELGHKIQKPSQVELDKLASKIKRVLTNVLVKKDVPGIGHVTLLKSPLILLIERNNDVANHSESLIKTINPGLTLLRPHTDLEPYDRHKPIDSIFSVSDAHFYIGPLNTPILRIKSIFQQRFIKHHFYEAYDTQIRNSSLVFESDVALTGKVDRPFKVLSSKNPFHSSDNLTIGEIKFRWLDKSRIEFTADIPPSLRKEFPELLIENGKMFVRLKIQSMDENGKAIWHLNVENNALDISAIVQAVIVRKNELYYSKVGSLLNIPSSAQTRTKLHLKSIQVANTEPAAGEKGPANTTIKLIFKSAAPITEVRIALSRTWHTHSTDRVPEPAFWGGQFEHGYPHFTSPESYKSEVDFLTFNEGDFTQTRVGDFVEVEIKREEFLKYLTVDMGTYTQKISWSYTYKHRGKKYVGIDYGRRKIVHVEAVSAALEQVSTKWRTSVGYQIYKEHFCRVMLKERKILLNGLQ